MVAEDHPELTTKNILLIVKRAKSAIYVVASPKDSLEAVKSRVLVALEDSRDVSDLRLAIMSREDEDSPYTYATIEGDDDGKCVERIEALDLKDHALLAAAFKEGSSFEEYHVEEPDIGGDDDDEEEDNGAE